MGMSERARIADALLAAGRTPDTPVAVVHWGTTAAQHVVRTTLAGLAAVDLPAPAVIVVGPVAALDLGSTGPRPAGPGWSGPGVTAAPLSGRRVVVTRARAQAAELVDRLTDLGATVVELPAIAIDDPLDGGAALEVAAHRLASGAYQWVALTSSNAVTRLLAALGDRSVPALRPMGGGRCGPPPGPCTDAGMAPMLVPEVALPEALAEVFPEPARASRPPPTPARWGGGGHGPVPAGRGGTGRAGPGPAGQGLVGRRGGRLPDGGRPSRPRTQWPPPATPTRWSSRRLRPSSRPSISSPPQGMPARGGLHRSGHLRRRPGRRPGRGGRGRPHTVDGLVAAVVAACGPHRNTGETA